MDAFNPLEATKRLEAAGIARSHAEAIASEINAARNELATKLSRDSARQHLIGRLSDCAS